MPNEVAKPDFQTQLAKVNDIFMPMIVDQLQGNGISMTEYQRTCVLNAMTAISGVLADANLTLKQVDQSVITNQLLTVAALQLNASAQPREIYFITRRHKNKETGQYYQEIEMGIEGDGNDALLARFGRSVKHVYPYWAVREGDGFEYAKHVGIESKPPTWSESGQGKVIRVVYPIEYTDGRIEYHIGEREDVKKNLLGHVSQNLMWDKAGAKDKFMAKAEDMKIDEILDDPDMITLGKISPAWASPQSRESMIIRKMRNNVTKKIPKDFSNGFIASEYEAVSDETYKAMRRDVTNNANSINFDSVPKAQPLPEQAVTREAPISTEDMPNVTDSLPNVQEETDSAQQEPLTEADEGVDPF